MNKKKWLSLGGSLRCIALLVNAAGSIVGDPMDGVFSEIKNLAGYERRDLLCLSGGYSSSFFGRSAKAEFQIKGGRNGKTIRISVHKPLHLLPWQVRAFENNSLGHN